MTPRIFCTHVPHTGGCAYESEFNPGLSRVAARRKGRISARFRGISSLILLLGNSRPTLAENSANLLKRLWLRSHFLLIFIYYILRWRNLYGDMDPQGCVVRGVRWRSWAAPGRAVRMSTSFIYFNESFPLGIHAPTPSPTDDVLRHQPHPPGSIASYVLSVLPTHISHITYVHYMRNFSLFRHSET